MQTMWSFCQGLSKITVTEKDQAEQMQQMPDSEEQETTLKVLTGETNDILTLANSDEMMNHLT